MFTQARGNTRLARGLVCIAAYASALLLVLTFCSTLMTTQPSQSGGSFTGFWTIVVLLLIGDSLVAWYAAKQGYFFEWRLERRFRKTCQGLGDDFVTIKRQAMMNPLWVLGGSLTRQRQSVVTPKLRSVNGTAESWSGLVYIFYGQHVETYNKNAASFAHAFGVKHCSFERTDGAAIRIRCGPIQVPDAYEYPAIPAQPLGLLETKRQLQTMDLARLFDPRTTLKSLPMAQGLDGKPYFMPIEENHILIAGESGSGKNSYTWSLVFGLREARRAGLVKLWGLDPKKVELSFGREHWDEYADTVEGMVELLEKAVADLLERNARIQGVARKIEPSPDMPLHIIIIDELAYLSALVPDKKLRDRGQAAIGTILWLGRATGYVLVAATQSSLKEVIGFRDHFLTKVALRMPASQVDLLLGNGAWENGAKCDLIPFKDAGAGCAYVLDQTSQEPFLVRSAWISDEAIQNSLDLPGDARHDLRWPQE